jgi:hypothetical protein
VSKLSQMEKDARLRQKEASTAEETRERTKDEAGREVKLNEGLKKDVKETEKKRRDFGVKCTDVIAREGARGTEADTKALEWAKNFKQNAVESLVFALIRMQVSQSASVGKTVSVMRLKPEVLVCCRCRSSATRT